MLQVATNYVFFRSHLAILAILFLFFIFSVFIACNLACAAIFWCSSNTFPRNRCNYKDRDNWSAIPNLSLVQKKTEFAAKSKMTLQRGNDGWEGVVM